MKTAEGVAVVSTAISPVRPYLDIVHFREIHEVHMY